MRAEYGQSHGETMEMPLALAFCAYTAIRARWGEEFGGPTYGEEDESAAFLGEYAAVEREARTLIRRLRRQTKKTKT